MDCWYARTSIARRDYAQARKHLVEAEELLRRGGMRLYLPELHLEWARLHVSEPTQRGLSHDIIKASEHLKIARELVDEMHFNGKTGEILALEDSIQAILNTARETNPMRGMNR